MTCQSASPNSTISSNISSSSFASSSRHFTPASSIGVGSNELLSATAFHHRNDPSTSSSSHHLRGRTNRKRSHSTSEHVCVIAFLVRGQTTKERVIIEKIQEIRRKFDQAYSRWEPHLTLIPPFIIPFKTSRRSTDAHVLNDEDTATQAEQDLLSQTLESLSSTIQRVCNHQAQHSLNLEEVDHFTLKRYDTFHLRPSPTADSSAFLRLQNELESALPQAQQSSRSKRRQQKDIFKPHLTLGQASNDRVNQELSRLAAQILNTESGSTRESFIVDVERIQLLVKPVNRSGPYDVYREFRLGIPSS